MARRTAKQKRKEKKIALGLAGALAAVVLTAALLASPAFAAWLNRALGIVQSEGPPPEMNDSPYAIHFIDVGQGDAVLMAADGEYALIDAGPPEAADALVDYLRLAGVQHLRYVFMTHPHADHIGGMQAVIENFEVGLVVMPGFAEADLGSGQETKETPVPTTVTYEKLLAAMLERGVLAELAVLEAVYPLGAGSVTVVHAGLPGGDNLNLLSLGLLYDAGGLRFLNTGDGENDNERAMLDSGLDLSAHVFSAAHHGSSTSNLKNFLLAVNPEAVVISCGAGNSYGHPHQSALGAYGGVEADVHRTDREGSIVVQPNGAGGLHISCTTVQKAA